MAQRPLYSPALSDENVRRLYRLKVATRKQTGRTVPMTVLLNRILETFFEAGLHDAPLVPTRNLSITAGRLGADEA